MDEIDRAEGGSDSNPQDKSENTPVSPPKINCEQTKKQHTNKRGKFRNVVRHCFIPFKKRWRRAPHDIVVMAATLIIAVVGFCQLLVYLQMKKIMKDSGKQTDQLIGAAGLQAFAATQNASAAASFATSAQGINTQTRLAVDKFERMAKASENSIKTIEKTAKEALDASIESSRIDQRAWVSLMFPIETADKAKIQPNGMIEFVLKFKNTGKTPALKISYDPLLLFRPPSAGFPDYDHETSENVYYRISGIHEAALLAPGEETRIAFPGFREIFVGPSQIDLMNNHETILYIVGKVTYRDIFPDTPQRTTKFCAFYVPGSGEVGACPMNRTMD
jgi:hypothetical protein